MYYTNELKRDYMATAYDMEFYEVVKDGEGKTKYYIHPNSYPIFEYEVGDLVMFDNTNNIPVRAAPQNNKLGRILYYKSEIAPYQNIMVLNNHFISYSVRLQPRIIERKEQTFFWPTCKTTNKEE